MTACYKLLKTLHQQLRLNPDVHCTPCVYFSKNLVKTEYPALMEKLDHCGLGFFPGDGCCTEMRTDNCSARKR